MKLTIVIQLCKNVFAINNGIIVLTFHELDLSKGLGRGLHGCLFKNTAEGGDHKMFYMYIVQFIRFGL